MERSDKMATFSVIVPVYNAAHTIERCVRSIAASGGEDVQIILVEDCSRDNSWEVCKDLSQRYGTVRCIRNEQNRGVSYTRNRGLEAAEAEYLLFVDSDDWVDPDYVPAFRQVITSGNKFAVCGYVNHDEKQNGRTDVFSWTDFEDTKTVTVKHEIEKLYHDRLFQQRWNKVFVTRIIREQNVCFDETISIVEYTRFILDYISRGGLDEIVLINRPLYHYMRDQDGSLMFRVGYESVEEPLKNLRKLYSVMGISDEEAEQRLRLDRQKQIESYAYLIMHNAGMTHKEKKRLIMALDHAQGKKLYSSNLILLWKERVLKYLKKCGLRAW